MYMLYNVMFYYHSSAVCSTLERAETQEEAGLQAEFRLMSLFPNVNYDNVTVNECA